MTNQHSTRFQKSVYGPTVLVTGASSGIGLAIARLLVLQGYTVIAASRFMTEAYPALVKQEPVLEKLIPIKLDVTDEQSCIEQINLISEKHGALSAVFHCAGSGIAGSVEETPLEDARWQMEHVFFGTVHVVRPALTVMRRQGKGLIVVISSMAASVPVPFQTYYSTAKASVLSFATGLADEVAPFGIRISVVSPGDTRTGFTASRRVFELDQAQLSPYSVRMKRSVARMAKDEQNGMDPDVIARAAVRNLYRRKPPLNRTPGLMYQLIMLALHILPTRLFRAVVRMLYA